MEHKHPVFDTDTHFTIDPITRQIKNASHRKTTLMQFDHNSERFTFECPRYIEAHDMAECNKVEVHYLNIDGNRQNSGVYTVDDLQVMDGDETQVTCSWVISANATQLAGTLSFLLRFLCVDGDIITYSWNTDMFTAQKISKGIDASGAFETKYADIIEQWKASVMAYFAGDLRAWKDKTVAEIHEDVTADIASLANYITPEMFGAVGDGVTDDSGAFVVAATFIVDNGVLALGGGKRYLVNAEIPYINIDGNGATLITKTDYAIRFTANEVRGKVIRNLNIDCDGHSGLHLASTRAEVFTNINLVNVGDCGVYIDSGFDTRFTDIYLRRPLGETVLDGTGIHVATSDCMFSGIIVQGFKRGIYDGGWNNWNNVHVWVGVGSEIDRQGSIGIEKRNGGVFNNIYLDSVQYGFYINTASDLRVSVKNVNWLLLAGQTQAALIYNATTSGLGGFMVDGIVMNIPTTNPPDYVVCNAGCPAILNISPKSNLTKTYGECGITFNSGLSISDHRVRICGDFIEINVIATVTKEIARNAELFSLENYPMYSAKLIPCYVDDSVHFINLANVTNAPTTLRVGEVMNIHHTCMRI